MPRLCQEFLCKFGNFLHRFNVLNPIPTGASVLCLYPHRENLRCLFSQTEKCKMLFISFRMEKDCPHSFPSVVLLLSLDKALNCFSSLPTGFHLTALDVQGKKWMPFLEKKKKKKNGCHFSLSFQ